MSLWYQYGLQVCFEHLVSTGTCVDYIEKMLWGDSFGKPSNQKSNLHYTRLIPIRVSRVSGAHLRGFAPLVLSGRSNQTISDSKPLDKLNILRQYFKYKGSKDFNQSYPQSDVRYYSQGRRELTILGIKSSPWVMWTLFYIDFQYFPSDRYRVDVTMQNSGDDTASYWPFIYVIHTSQIGKRCFHLNVRPGNWASMYKHFNIFSYDVALILW